MKRKDIYRLVTIGFIAAIISVILSSLLFSPPKHDSEAPTVQPIANSFPDIKNDPDYNVIFNSKALDLSQPVHLGGNQNTTPFTSP